jgi:hypothetical protein
LPGEEKKRKILSSLTFSRKDHPPMISHDTLLTEDPQGTARQGLIIEKTGELLLQACGLGEGTNLDQWSQAEQNEPTPRRGRGRPQQVCWIHLWSSLLLCALQGMHSFADWRRLVGLQQIGPFAPVWLTRNGLVKRLLQAGLVPLQELWEMVNVRLAHTGPSGVSAEVAAFATGIFALDETRLDTVGRYLKPLHALSTQDPACFAGKLVGLFDLRNQRWSQWEWRENVQENCRVDMLDFLQELWTGSLLLFDLGYFSFPFFDTLTQRKVWWVSRYRENTSYSIAHVFYRHQEKLDALIWLGTGKKQARHLIRLVRLGDGIGVRMYLTNVCDPQMLSLGEVAQLYARRWDIEMAFRLLKEYLGMSHWWSSKQELILLQIWVVLILSHIIYALRERMAVASGCNPFEVSVPLLVELLPRLHSTSALQLEQLIQSGRQSGLLRASPRLELSVAGVEQICYQLAPPDLPRQRPGRAPTPRYAPWPKPSTRACGYQIQRQRRQTSQHAKVIRAAQGKAALSSTGVT